MDKISFRWHSSIDEISESNWLNVLGEAKNIPFYHICFEVIDIEKKINFFEEEGGIIISAPAPAVLFNGRKVSFIYTEIGIVELLEAEN